MSARDLNADLVGVPEGRGKLQTPALVIDLDVLERNIAHMAEFAAKRGIQLRPHAKTHKSAEIARRQIEAGALGVCVAKLGEAEALADAGVENLLITSPVVTDKGIERLIASERARARSDGDVRQRASRGASGSGRKSERQDTQDRSSTSIPA